MDSDSVVDSDLNELTHFVYDVAFPNKRTGKLVCLRVKAKNWSEVKDVICKATGLPAYDVEVKMVGFIDPKTQPEHQNCAC